MNRIWRSWRSLGAMILLAALLTQGLEAVQMALIDKNGRRIVVDVVSVENGVAKVRMGARVMNMSLNELSPGSRAALLADPRFRTVPRATPPTARPSQPVRPSPPASGAPASGLNASQLSRECPSIMVQPTRRVIYESPNSSIWTKLWNRNGGIVKPMSAYVQLQEGPKPGQLASIYRSLGPTNIRSGVLLVDFTMPDSHLFQFGMDHLNDGKLETLFRVHLENQRLTIKSGFGKLPVRQVRTVGESVIADTAPGKWHQLMAEFHQQEMLVHFDGKVIAHAQMEVDQWRYKNRINIISGGLTQVRRVSLWEGDGDPRWGAIRNSVIPANR